MHGELLKALCARCGARHDWSDDISVETPCPGCGQAKACAPTSCGSARCPITWSASREHLAAADLFISIGTSGNVYPAAGFVAEARANGAHTVELNLEPSEGASFFAEAIHGPATHIVPAYVHGCSAGEGGCDESPHSSSRRRPGPSHQSDVGAAR